MVKVFWGIFFISIKSFPDLTNSPSIAKCLSSIERINQNELCDSTPTESPDCRAIKEYPREEGVLLSFEGGPSTSLCYSHWEKQKMQKTNFNLCGSPADRYDSRYVSRSQKQMEKSGAESLLSSTLETKRKEIFALAEKIRAEVAATCCGNDSTCLQTMNKVNVQMCEPPSDPKAPDRCSNNAYYSPKLSEVTKMWGSFRQFYNSKERKNSIELPKIRNVIDRFYPSVSSHIGMFIESLGQGFKTPPFSGDIVLSPYFKKNSSNDLYQSDLNPATITHEFFHACDFIRAQQMALNSDANSHDAYLAVKRLEAQTLTAAPPCETSVEFDEFYRRLSSQIVEPEVSPCLEKIFEKVTDPNSPNFCATACKKNYFFESFAMVGEILSASNKDPAVYPIKTCFGNQDTHHPQSFDIFECLVQHSPKYRKKMNEVLSCE